MPPLVSVVIPHYNATRFIQRAVRSALAQSYDQREIIVVDDGSREDVTPLLAPFGDAVTLIRQANAGPSRARNAGIAVSHGEYIAFLDADDEWHPRKLDIQVARLTRDPLAVASMVGAEHVDVATGRRTVVAPRRSADPIEDMLLHGTVLGPTSALVVRRSILDRVGGFDPTTDQVEDLDLALRLASVGRIDVVEAPLVMYRVHAGNSSLNAKRMAKSWRAILDKFYRAPENRARYGHIRRTAYGNLHIGVSGAYLRSGDLAASVRALVLALLYRPATMSRALGLPIRRMRRFLVRGRPRARS